MFKRKSALFLVSLLFLASILMLGPVPTSAGIVRLYSVSTTVAANGGIEVTNHTLSHASDNAWYQINAQKVGANYVINVTMFYYTAMDPTKIAQIYVFSEAHVASLSNPVGMYIHNGTDWELCFSVDVIDDTPHSYTITMNTPNYINATGWIKLKVYYFKKVTNQSFYQDHTYIELTPKVLPPVADFTWTPERPQVNETVTFNASTSKPDGGTILWYYWDFGDYTPPVNTTELTTTHAYTSYGTYNVTLTIQDSEGLSDSVTKAVKVCVPPVIVSIDCTPEVPSVNETVTFNATAYDPDGTIVSYDWDFGDGTPHVIGGDEVKIVNHTYTSGGTFNVTLTVTDNDNKTDTDSIVISVVGYPVARFTYTPIDPLLGQTVTFNASASTPDGGTIANYTWDFGDYNITTVTESIVTHVYTAYANYTVTLNVTDDEGLWDTATDVVRVYPRPPVAIFDYSPKPPVVGEIVTFNASASYDPDGTIVDYAWNFSDDTPIAHTPDKTINHTYAASGTYKVTLVVTDNDNKTGSTFQLITLGGPPVANFTWSPEIPVTGETVTFDASNSTADGGTIDWYYWDFGDYTYDNKTVPTTTHAYAAAGNYTVTLTIQDSEGLTNSTAKLLVVYTHDVAVVSVTVVPSIPEATWVYPSWTVNITVAVLNEGNFTENFTVTIYYNRTATEWVMIGNETVIGLGAGASIDVLFIWDTTDVPPSVVDHTYSVYAIKANASVVPDETHVADNVRIEGTVRVNLPGDADGSGFVDIGDFGWLGAQWFKALPEADFDESGFVDIGDFGILGAYWFKGI